MARFAVICSVRAGRSATSFIRSGKTFRCFSKRSRAILIIMKRHADLSGGRWCTVGGRCRPRRVPHFHINLLPDARKMSTTRALMSAYLSYLYRCGEKRVYGQIVTFESRRGEKMFERYGFKVLNRAEITKYKAFYPQSVYLSTVIKNLETAEPLTVTSRSR